jgi:hypothetical protein
VLKAQNRQYQAVRGEIGEMNEGARKKERRGPSLVYWF